MKAFNLKLFFSILNSICKSLPSRNVKTFLELFIGAILSTSGHITQAYLRGNFQCHWTTYYKWLSGGEWEIETLIDKYIIAITNLLFSKNIKKLRVLIDDTIVYRSSKNAPQAKIDFEHSAKNNRAKYVLGQTWVTAAICFFTKKNKPVAIPAISRLAQKKGNKNKIEIAVELLESICHAINDPFEKLALVDAWFMKKTFIIPALELGYQIIGQARIDTFLYLDPVTQKKGRGRKKKFGEKITLERAMKLKSNTTEVFIYGNDNLVRYRSLVVKVKFLDGLPARAVWCEIYNKKKNIWSKPSLILSTEINLMPLEIIKEYSCRWPIESFFNQIKNNWGMKEAWQRTEKALMRWFHINCIAYGVMAVVNIYSKENRTNVFDFLPWRKNYEVTSGMIREYMNIYFSTLSIRELWSDKSRKIIVPENAILKENRKGAP